MSAPVKKILFAAGGTGGHLFPAQALAEQIQGECSGIDVLFAGAKLSSNVYFDQERFRCFDVASMTPFRGGFFRRIRSLGALIQGILEGLRLISEEKPDLVVGFGSFHAFPVLCAAVLKNIPLILFESNAMPGKVVRLFSRRAQFTGIYFSEARKYLKGKIVDVEIPKRAMQGALRHLDPQAARSLWGLDPDVVTLLVFGGSQGARRINEAVCGLLPLLSYAKLPVQLLHFTGDECMADKVSQLCHSLGIASYVKKFEPQMHVAWSAADIVLCRAGAMTLSELLDNEVPGVLVPYPKASEGHQLKNALFLEKQVGGAVLVEEGSLTPESLFHALIPLLVKGVPEREALKKAIVDFKAAQKKADLCRLIQELLYEK
jgi:UDP-N-acetylglucosamine--N-acetylmuramyl-(pentapeptide) pyrophosphoryl-undecaprenol N-acetylglucosamine transferase